MWYHLVKLFSGWQVTITVSSFGLQGGELLIEVLHLFIIPGKINLSYWKEVK